MEKFLLFIVGPIYIRIFLFTAYSTQFGIYQISCHNLYRKYCGKQLLCETILSKNISKNYILISFDDSLFTNIPVRLALECVRRRWLEIAKSTPLTLTTFLEEVELCSTYFVLDHICFCQMFSTPMVSPLPPMQFL